MKRMTVLIDTDKGFIPVRCLFSKDGLAVTKGKHDGFRVTHELSGLALVRTWRTRAEAKAALLYFLKLWNWRRPSHELRKDKRFKRTAQKARDFLPCALANRGAGRKA